MRRLYSDGGTELAQIFRSTRAQGAATSLDMTHVDRRSEAGKVNWIEFLRTVLPQVDLFLPSLDEILFMLQAEPCNSQCPDAGTLDGIADKLLKMGCAIVVLKLGENGLFVKTTESLERLRSVGGNLVPEPRRWLDRTVIAPNFIVEVAGTTGAGDCAIAGFLAGLLKGLALDEAATTAAAAGACCVEKVDATSGVPSWDALQKRIRSGWKRRPAIA
jgi:sugar/nucleoside kinase (ribokinase family)